MSSDGSTQGITSKRALDTILGGEPAPGEDEEQTPQQVRERVMAATPDSYEGATECITRAMLRTLENDETARTLPLEPETAFVVPQSGDTLGWTGGGEGVGYRRVEPGTETRMRLTGDTCPDDPEYVVLGSSDTLWDRAKTNATDDEADAFGNATGFMAGFAYNQARWLLGLPPHPNPAIIEVGGS